MEGSVPYLAVTDTSGFGGEARQQRGRDQRQTGRDACVPAFCHWPHGEERPEPWGDPTRFRAARECHAEAPSAGPTSSRAGSARGGSRIVHRPEVSGGRRGHSSGFRASGHAVTLSSRCVGASARVRRGPAPSPCPCEHGSKGKARSGEGPCVMSDTARPPRFIYNFILSLSWEPALKLNSWGS